jgi:hypothetical protein
VSKTYRRKKPYEKCSSNFITLLTGVVVFAKSAIFRLVNTFIIGFLLEMKHELTRRFLLQKISENIRALSGACPRKSLLLEYGFETGFMKLFPVV